MPNKTANFALNQWEPEDNFLRTDFNEDNVKIEAALTELETQVSGKCGAVFGSYTGNDQSSRVIELGFRPSAVLLERSGGTRTSSGNVHGGIILPNLPLGASAATICDTGFTVYNNGGNLLTNSSSYTFYYIAFR